MINNQTLQPNIRTGDVLFILGDTKISWWVRKAQYAIHYTNKYLLQYVNKEKYKPYNNPKVSHVLISIDKGMFIHAAGGRSVVYTTLDEYISKGLDYIVYRKDDFCENTDIKNFTDLPKYYQKIIKNKFIQKHSLSSITKKEIDEYAFHLKHLTMKYELEKNYATHAVKRVLYWWLNPQQTKIKFNEDSYCSKFVADLLYNTHDIGFEPKQIILPAYLELKLSDKNSSWHKVSNQYKTIQKNKRKYKKTIYEASLAKLKQEIIQTNINYITESTNLELDTIEIKIDYTTDSSTLKSLRPLLIALVKAKRSSLENRWSDYKTDERIGQIRNKLSEKLLVFKNESL